MPALESLISGRAIQITARDIISVQDDTNTQTIEFVFDKDNLSYDLSTLNPFVVYRTAQDNGARFEICTKTVTDNDIRVQWVIRKPVTYATGRLQFQVIFTDTPDPITNVSEHRWSTTITTVTIPPTLAKENYAIEPEPIIEQMMSIAAEVVEAGDKVDRAEAAAERAEDAADSIQEAVDANEAAQAAKTAAETAKTAAVTASQAATLAASQVQAIVAGNEAYTKAESDQKYATAPYKTTTGSGYVVVEDGDNGTAEVGFFGNSVQDGTPSPDSPVPVVSVGEIPKDSNGKEIRNLLDEASAGNKESWTEGSADSNFYYIKLCDGPCTVRVQAYENSSKGRPNAFMRLTHTLSGWQNDGDVQFLNGTNPASSGSVTAQSSESVYVKISSATFEDETRFYPIFDHYQIMITDAATIDAYRPYIGENNGLLRVVNTTGSEQRDGWIQLKEPLRKVGDIADSIAPDGTVVQKIDITNISDRLSSASLMSTTAFNENPPRSYVSPQVFDATVRPNKNALCEKLKLLRTINNGEEGLFMANSLSFCLSTETLGGEASQQSFYNWIKANDINVYSVMNIPTTYTTPMPDFITGEGVTTFLTPDGEVVPDIFVRYKQTVKGAALDIVEEDKNRKIYGVSITKQENGNIQSSPTLTRTDDAVGLTAQATTNGAAVTNDFDTAADWPKMFRCNGYYSDTGQFIITSKKGEPGYDAVNQDVFWCCERFYHKRTETSEAITHQISTKPFPGAALPTVFTGKDGEALDYWVTGAYEGALVDNRLVSRSGLIPGDSISMNTGITYCRNAGDYYHLQTSDEKETLRLLIMIEFATLNTQTALGEGATGLRFASDQATVATSSGNRFITTNAIADNFVVGQTIAIGTSGQGGNIANNRIITSITTYDSNNKAINFDGTAVTIAVGNYISSRPWKTGDTDSVVASSGSKGSKHSTMYRGYENPFGNCWEVVGDMIFHNGSSTYYKCADPDKWVTNSVLTDDYIPLAYGAPAAEGYCTKLGYDQRFPYTALTEAVGGSSSTYYCDYFYRNPSTTSPDTLREVLVGGGVGHGVGAGLSCWNLNDAVSYSGWSIAGRLSGTGRGGPGDTSPGNTAS